MSAAPTRPGSLDVTASTPNTRPLTRSGTRTTERVPKDAGARHVDGRVGRLDVVHDHRETGHGNPGGARPGVVERELHGSEPPLGLDTSRRPVTPDDAPVRVHDEQIGALIAHGVDQALQRLLVDLLRVQRRADGGGQLAQQRELLDRCLEVAKLLLELVVRVQDLLGLQIQHPLRVVPSGALEQRVADRSPEEQGQETHDRLRSPRQHTGRGEPRRQSTRGADPQHGRDPEPPAQGRVPPAHLDDARIRATRRALSLDDRGAGQPPVGGKPLPLDVLPDAKPPGHDVARTRRSPEGGLAAALDQHVEPAEALDRGRRS